jgi:tetratricopeptide (TPR) repeat protein
VVLAAVVGREFDLRTVASAAGWDLGDALDAVDLAVLAGLVTESDDAPASYRFSHALVRDTVYAGTAGLRRADLHAGVAKALASAPNADARLTELAHHFAEAAATLGPDQAISFAVRAAAAAQAGLAFEAAEDHLRRALGLVEHLAPGPERDRREFEIVLALATLLSLIKSIADTETGDAWARATELGRRVEGPAEVLRSMWGVFIFALGRADLERAEELALQIAELAAEAPDESFAAAGHLARGGVAFFLGRVGEARRQLEQGKAVCDTTPDLPATQVIYTDLPVSIDGYLAMVLALAGEPATAGELSRGMVARATWLAHPFTLAIALQVDVVASMFSIDVPLLRTRSDELLAVARSHHLRDFIDGAEVAQGWLLAHEGDPGAGLALIGEAIARMRTTGQRAFWTLALGKLAEAHRQAGQLDEAVAVVDEALAVVEDRGQRFYEAELHRIRGELLAAVGRHQEGESSLRRAVAVAGAQGAELFRERAEGSLARLLGPDTA